MRNVSPVGEKNPVDTALKLFLRRKGTRVYLEKEKSHLITYQDYDTTKQQLLLYSVLGLLIIAIFSQKPTLYCNQAE
jgi:hypothetical protein